MDIDPTSEFGELSFVLASSSLELRKPARDHGLMKGAQLTSVFARRCAIRNLVLCIVLLCVAAPSRSPGQDAGVSGIAPGPANARGLNGSINDPSGIGNAARVPAIPPPAIRPPSTPTAAPATPYRSVPVQQGARIRRPLLTEPRSRHAARSTQRHRNKRGERNKLSEGVPPSICRGC
jgi:hypothetical protein